jgi:hypothetical protein
LYRYRAVSKMNKQIESIEDMQRFIESFPEFRQQSGNVSKHVALMSELSRIIGEDSLMTVSQVEQEVACGSDRVYAYNSTMQQLADTRVGLGALSTHVILQSQHQLMTAGMVHVTNLAPGSANPTRG